MSLLAETESWMEDVVAVYIVVVSTGDKLCQIDFVEFIWR